MGNRSPVRERLIESLEARQLLSAGDVDTAFGLAGVASVTFSPPSGSTITCVGMDVRGGKTLLLGRQASGSTTTGLALARLTASGLADTAFDFDGKITLGGYDPVRVLLQADGKTLVLARRLGSTVAAADRDVILRFGTNGKLDTTFGKGGVADSPIRDAAINLAADGKIWLAGTNFSSKWAVARLTTSGALDTSFAGTGSVSFSGLTGGALLPNAIPTGVGDISVNADGSLILGGFTQEGGAAVAKMTTAGKLDTAFAGGKGWFGFGYNYLPGGSTVLPSGKIVMVATWGKMLDAFRLNADGTPDTVPATGNNHYQQVSLDLSEEDDATNIFNVTTVRAGTDGKLLVIAQRTNFTDPDGTTVATRFNADGTLDKTFTPGLGFEPVAGPYGDTQTDNKLIAVGTTFKSSRYLYDAGTDSSGIVFDAASGKLTVNNGSGSDTLRARNVQPIPFGLTDVLRIRNGTFYRGFNPGQVKSIVFNGNAGNDTLDISAAHNSNGDGIPSMLNGGDGNDTLTGGTADDALFGGNGNDILRGGDGADYLDGGAGADKAYGDGGNDTLYSRDNTADTIDGGIGNDLVDGDLIDTFVSVVPNDRTTSGWSSYAPAADSRVIYLDNTPGGPGKDTNSGLSASTPVFSWSKAVSLMRSGYPDWLLIKRGTTFNLGVSNWNKSGRSASAPMVISTYGDTKLARPKFLSGSAAYGFSTETRKDQLAAGVRVNHLAMIGLEFTPGTPDTTSIRRTGFGSVGGLSDLTIEDCIFRGYQDNLSLQNSYAPISLVRIRRSQIVDAYGANSSVAGQEYNNRSQGIYCDGVQGLLMEENVVDHNGWNESIAGAGPSMFNQAIYLNVNNTDVMVRDNIISRSSGHGLQARAGGFVRGNVFLDNAFGLSYGYVNTSAVLPGGVSGDITGNVFIGSRDVPWDTGEWAMEIGNLKPKSAGGGTVVANNLIIGDTQGDKPAVFFRYTGSTTNPQQDVGINDLTFTGNTIYGWTKGLELESGYIPGSIGVPAALNNLIVAHNDIQSLTSLPLVNHAFAFSPDAEHWSGNRYDCSPSATGTFTVNGAATTFAMWQSQNEPTAQAIHLHYADATRTAEAYNASLGGAATLSGFLTKARAQTKAAWDTRFASKAVIAYEQGGFAVV